jgi:hypothetical protein
MVRVRRINKWLRRTFTGYFSAKVALAILVFAVSAASITANTKTYQGEIGGALNITNNLVGTDKGLSQVVTGSTAAGTTSCAFAVIFGTAIANNGITALHFIYAIRVNETLTTIANHCFQATLVLTPNGGSATTYGPLFMNSTATNLVTNRVDCQFDIGISIPASPYSFQVTVQ